MGIEYVPHPDPDRHQMIAMPDIVFQEGNHPRVTVFDAKYVGRSWVARNASRLHEKYSRMRLNGTPVVGNVLAIHPHRDLEAQWAGYGYIAMAPGLNGSRVPLPTPAVSKCEIVDESHNSAVSHPKLVPKCQEPPPNRQRMSLSPAQLEAEPVAVVVDQFWMHGQLRIAESS